MNILRSLSVLAALSLAGAAYAQDATAPTADAPSVSVKSPTANPEIDGASTAQRHDSLRMAAAGRAGNIATGMQVRSPSGDLLGNVASLVPGESNHDGYVVVANSSGIATPLPLKTATTLVQNQTLVVDKARFQNAPKVQQHEESDVTRAAWKEKADEYWTHHKVSLD